MINCIKRFLHWAVPRFVTDDMVCYMDKDGMLQASVRYVEWVYNREYEDSKTPDAIVQVESFSWFGKGYFPKVISEPIDYYEYIKGK